MGESSKLIEKVEDLNKWSKEVKEIKSKWSKKLKEINKIILDLKEEMKRQPTCDLVAQSAE